MKFPIDAFIQSLQDYDAGSSLFNPWRDVSEHDVNDQMPGVRRALLKAHLWCETPQLIIINDTVSFYGSRQTGVPITSEYLVLNHRIPRLHYDGRMTNTTEMFADPGAGLFWQLLPQAGLAEQTLCWDLLPFQPFKPSTQMNRAPTKDEMKLGLDWTRALIGAFPNAAILAVGARVRDALSRMGYQFYTTKHPSHGGAGTLRSTLNQIALETGVRVSAEAD